jgi:hypothetical protein
MEQSAQQLSLAQQAPQLMHTEVDQPAPQQLQQPLHDHQQLQQQTNSQQQQQQQQQQPLQKVDSNPGASQPLVQFLAGGLAGALAWMSIYPIDVIKCRMQVRACHIIPQDCRHCRTLHVL